MRTRKHQSPVESTWVEKPQCVEAPRASCEAQAGNAAAPPKGQRERSVSNGVSLSDSGENSLNIDQKKANGKRQKRRRKSPKNKVVLPSFDCTLAGLMADTVWLDKCAYEEAERAYYTKGAAEQARAPETNPLTGAVTLTPRESEHIGSGTGHPPISNCCHSGLVACHHVDNGIWLNKLNFDDAEHQFVMRFGSPFAPHSLELPLRQPESGFPGGIQGTPDEGYVSAIPTPASHPFLDLGSVSSLVPSSDPTVNGKPHWAGLQDLLAEVWLDKPAYDQAERSFYETVARSHSPLRVEAQQHWGVHSGKKNKRDKWNRKSTTKQATTKKCELPVIPEETGGLLHKPVYYFLHPDSETVWLDKTSYDRAEATFYIGQHLGSSLNFKDSPASKLSRPAKSKRCGAPCHSKKMSASFISTEKVWLDKCKYDDAERQYYETLSRGSAPNNPHNSPQEQDGASTILRDIARARENIQKSLAGLRTVLHNPKEAQAALPQGQTGPRTSGAASNSGDSSELAARVANLEQENQSLHKVVKDLQSAISKLESRLSTLEKSASSQPPIKVAAPVQKVQVTPAAKEENGTAEDDDDDIDLFGSDEEEDAEAERIREERLRQYAEKKAKKPGVIAKSSILLDVKPWDDETDMAKLEECVRTVQMDGLLWGSSKLVPVGYGIKKLQIQCVVEDDKVGTDILEEEITKFEDYVQSVDIAAFNKI
ncbi:elongation factor 1-delta isoform X1 [Xenopus tropicalis]|nr:elongation factor 1-delta isoform X1 [Xenopus tropicalis]XP_012820591.1 elongation factor 1-delta isoform X1 [Xenopus tropicalis]|eukprot:XP_012820591.1 PREDICTED: elongation factor 1-delta isoform X2 [Xenopus tropicalis]